jgi:hypothetical protein
MSHRLRCRGFSARAVVVLLAVSAVAGTLRAQASDSIGPAALQQIQALQEAKRSRTSAQRRVDSNLLFEAKQRRGIAVAAGVPRLQTGIEVSDQGTVVVDITATVSDSLLDAIERLGGHILQSHSVYRSIRTEIPLFSVETLAAHPDILFIQPKQEATTNRGVPPEIPALRGVTASLLESVRSGFAARAAAVRSQLAAALARSASKEASGAKPLEINKINTSQGVVTHGANLAQSTFGAMGAGVKVGVLSDGVDSLASLQASGDLPAVTVLPGQAGSGDEGAAMLEIVYDMAPAAQLYFATAFNGISSFAQNIHDLRTAGCHIIIDDVSYFVETPFQKGQTGSVASTSNGGLVIQAVNDVTAAGALYFSSAANSGGKDKNTSGTWEGNFVDGGAADPGLLEAGRLHDFDPSATVTPYDALSANGGGFPALFWSDPLGGAANDYDLFLLNPSGTSLVGASNDFQTGTQDPVEIINVESMTSGQRLVIVKFSGAARFLHLDTNRGRLTFNTQGSTHGHNSPPGANAFGVAATPAADAIGPPPNPTGPYPNPFNSSNTIELFSSDGPRHWFFNADSSAITPGDFLATGGQILNQPLITAADGVSCAAPGFGTFYGTSAAAPHAGAIAALVKSENPSLTSTQISTILTSTAIDIEAAGLDRDSGFGILDAFSAVQAAVPVTTGLNFYTLPPCRIVDTRNPAGPLGGPSLTGGASRTFVVINQCSLPATASAIAVNVAETNAQGSGNLKVYPGGTSVPNASTINFSVGQSRSNNAVVPLGASGDISVFASIGSGLHVDFILDIVGYFAP